MLGTMNKTFRPYDLNQRLLLPPDLREWLPEGHLALFISDVVDELDLSAIFEVYEDEGRGQPPYHPALMVKLLLYAYCIGKPSSRKIERATYEDVAVRVLAADQHPDHDSLAAFRARHLAALAGLFVQVLRLCQTAGLVKLGHVALDGTKIKANASKHKAMSYARMGETERRLEREVQALLGQAEQVDAREDAEYGRGRRGEDLPAELARRESRLPTIPDPEQARPEPTAQRNFTDPDSHIMKDGATKSFEQAYNAQAVVDGGAQIIVACGLTQAAADAEQFVPLVEQVTANTGQPPAAVLADAGYFSESNLTAPGLSGVERYVPPDRHPHGEPAAVGRSRSPTAEQMRAKLRSAAGHAVYALRKAIVEPVFG